MGDYIKFLHSDIFISAKDINFVHQAIKNLATETHRGSGWTGESGEKTGHFSFVNTEILRDSKTLEDALDAWRWGVGFDDHDNLNELFFREAQKLGDEAILFETIAPWVRDDSYVLVGGEEGQIRRWYFKDGVCKEQTAKLMFEND